MASHFFLIKLKDKNYINLNNNRILELFKLSFGNKITNLYCNKNKKDLSYSEDTKIVNKKFILNNIKRTKLIIENKKNNLKENFENKKQIIKIKIKFLDNILYLNLYLKIVNHYIL